MLKAYWCTPGEDQYASCRAAAGQGLINQFVSCLDMSATPVFTTSTEPVCPGAPARSRPTLSRTPTVGGRAARCLLDDFAQVAHAPAGSPAPSNRPCPGAPSRPLPPPRTLSADGTARNLLAAFADAALAPDSPPSSPTRVRVCPGAPRPKKQRFVMTADALQFAQRHPLVLE